MGRPKGGDRVLGPYGPYVDAAGAQRWKVVLVSAATGKRQQPSFSSEQEAHDYIAGVETARRRAISLTVGEAIQQFVAARVAGPVTVSGQGGVSAELAPVVGDAVVTLTAALKGFFHGCDDLPLVGLLLRESVGGKPVARAVRLYAELQTRTNKTGRRYAVATHRDWLHRARQFLYWCVTEGHLADNPLALIRGVGERGGGKPQLGFDETKRWMEVALRRAHAGDVGAAAAMTALLLGLRQAEATTRRCGDIDNRLGPGPMIFRVRRAKTRKGVRNPEIPLVLDPIIRRLLEGRQPEDFLFGCPVPHEDPPIPDEAERYPTAKAAAQALAARAGVRYDEGNWLRRPDGTRVCQGWNAWTKRATDTGEVVQGPDGWRVTAPAVTGAARVHRCVPRCGDWLRQRTMAICREAGVKQVCAHSLRGLASTLGVRSGALPHQVAAELGHESFSTTERHYLAPGTLAQMNQQRLVDMVTPQDEVERLRAELAQLKAQLATLPPPPPVLPPPARGRAHA